MSHKWLVLLTLLILALDYAECKVPTRMFVMKEDKPPYKKPLRDFTAYDSREKNRLYLVRTTTTDIDAVNIFDYRARSMVANAEGEWIGGAFNVSLSIYDSKSNQWIEGTITRVSKMFSTSYKVRWNNEQLLIKHKTFTKTIEIYHESPSQLLATFRYRSIWRSGTKYFYDVKIYTSRLPDSLFILLVTIMNHTDHIHLDDDR